MSNTISQQIDCVIESDHHDPFVVLGLHFIDQEPQAALVRTFQPHAESVQIVVNGEKRYMYKMRQEGLFEIVLPEFSEPFPYHFEIQYYDKTVYTAADPYCFLPQLGEIDRYLFNSGTHYRLYNKLGAHRTSINDIDGTLFRVWAPAARRVSVIGNFNSWDGRLHQMRSIENSGIWEIFIPGITENELYKYEIRTQYKDLLIKSDPFQFFGELRPRTASKVFSLDNYSWNDSRWLEKRKSSKPYDKPIAIYEVHLGSWRRDPGDPARFLTYREVADTLVPYVKEMGFTHIELMPVMEHPLDESWGYQVTAYYSVTSRYGTPDEFMYLVDLCHQNDIAVILDWVPAHFPSDAHSLARFDGTALYEHEDPRQGAHPEWGTMIFNYGRKEVSNFLIANALFWFDKYHIDGLRVDAVASMLYLDYSRQEGEWVPNCYGGKENIDAIEFLRHLNSIIYDHYPNVMMIAEESTSFFGVSKPADVGGLGFGFKWNMGWMNDTLNYISKDPLYRKYHHNALTFSLYYAFTENFILSISHDEVVHGKRSLLAKMPGDLWQQFANLRVFLLLQWCHPGKKLIFMGSEFGQWSEWYCKTSLDWHLPEHEDLHKQLQEFVRALNRIYLTNPSFWEVDFSYDGFRWLDFNDVDNSVIGFARFGFDHHDHVVCVFNFTPQVISNYKMGVPENVSYQEIFNSDYHSYGGSNVLNINQLDAVHEPFGFASQHVTLNLPPLGGIILKPVSR
ncbi:MAG: 1,4-alpha-glucan branching protein GlgB [Deltaproteobacteria bacterium]|jgi:1,4-alpha-glucan branching enzyme|nr:1,4-alpha-glucan branching protein GlgB [Deltaproteobacteria bacterium]